MKKIIIIVIFILIIIFSILIHKQNEKFKTNQNRKPIVFLHIPKNAGSSIQNMYKSSIEYRDHYECVPKKDEINFAVIRHPITRLQSIFGHIKDKTVNNKSYDLRKFNTLGDLANAYYNIHNPNHKKAKQLLEWNIDKLKSYRDNGCSENKSCIHWCPQHLFVKDNEDGGKVDYFLKFENLKQDLKKLAELNILIDKPLERINSTPNNFKIHTNITPLCKKLVNDIYGEDLKLWQNAGLN